MQNPWNSLPVAAPYVLPEDAPILLKYASKLTGDKAVRPEVLPAPSQRLAYRRKWSHRTADKYRAGR